MKHFLSLTLLAAFTVAPSFGTIYPTTFTDANASNDPNDVFGDPAKFDIYSLTLSNFNIGTGELAINIDFNYGGGFTAGAFQGFTIPGFSIGSNDVVLNVGDIFFTNSTSKFAIVMSDHDGLNQGSLYSITATQTSGSVLGNPVGYYRPTQAVWADPTGASEAGTGTVTATNNGGYRYDAAITVSTDAAFRALLDGTYDVSFESATCGNDVVEGTVAATATPESGTMAMLGAGLLAVGLLRRKA